MSIVAHEEIAARELKPALLELDGISRESIEAHYKLYEGYVNKRNEILGRLADVDLSAANQVYSEFRALKVELSFAVGGVKNHEIYFEHLGGGGGEREADAGLIGGAGAGRQEDRRWVERHRRLHVDLVVAADGGLGPELAEIVEEVVGEAVVVVD